MSQCSLLIQVDVFHAAFETTRKLKLMRVSYIYLHLKGQIQLGINVPVSNPELREPFLLQVLAGTPVLFLLCKMGFSFVGNTNFFTQNVCFLTMLNNFPHNIELD